MYDDDDFLSSKSKAPIPVKEEVQKVCSQCGGPRKNEAYGTRCEDCFVDDVPAVRSSNARRGK